MAATLRFKPSVLVIQGQRDKLAAAKKIRRDFLEEEVLELSPEGSGYYISIKDKYVLGMATPDMGRCLLCYMVWPGSCGCSIQIAGGLCVPSGEAFLTSHIRSRGLHVVVMLSWNL